MKQEDTTVWSVQGNFLQIIYSPKGGVEGFLIDTDGIPTQFVTDPHDDGVATAIAALSPGQPLEVEGTVAKPSDKGDAQHTVYILERLAKVDGLEPTRPLSPTAVTGTVTHINFAKHGEANGVILDSGDFVHLKPKGFSKLGLKIGQQVAATGLMRPLVTGRGHVVEAETVNGKPVP